MFLCDNLQISTNLGSLNWRELSPQVTEGVPARRRQSAQCIVAVRSSRHHPSASLPPSSERRAKHKPTCDDVVGRKVRFANIKESFGFFIHRCTESNCKFAQTTSPATRPWVGSVARNTLAIQNSRTESNKTPTATPKPPPRKERSEWSKNKVLCLAFFQEREPPEAPRPRKKALNRLRANEDVYGWEVGCCKGC